MTRRRTVFRAGAILLVAAVALALLAGPGWVESWLQGVVPHEPYQIDADAAQLHDSLVVADWHSDTLLWGRDPGRRSERGHVDLPRLQEGNVAIQMFTAVTKMPRGLNYESNAGDSDNVTALVILHLWPPRTWTSLFARAIHQSERLHRLAERAPERVAVVRTAVDLRRVLALRESRPPGERPVAALLGIEGAHALEGAIENVDRLYDAGFRMVGLQHFFDNRLGGSLHGQSGGGLTEFGRAVVRRLERHRMVVDVAHSSPAVVDDVLAMASRPVVVSHTGLHGACESPRNLSDTRMKRIADAGGIVAVGYWDAAACDISPAGVVRSLRYAVDLLGVDHVALGSDFDGATRTTFDTSELAVLTQTMLQSGFTREEIRKVMGENTVRFLEAQLPPS
jgi:microsomal dipeptidase-like Zn-dependent dipeptidase